MRNAATCKILLSIAIACAVACPAQAAKKSKTPVTASAKNIQMSPQELRIRVRALIRPTLGIVEQAADGALRESPDPAVRREVITWKIETTTTILSAMLRQDPVLAFVDTWGYVLQVKTFLGREDMKARYGDFGGVASEALAEIEQELRNFVDSLHEGVSPEAVEAKVQNWADQHPIEGALYRRPSMDTAVASLLATSSGGGAMAAISGLEETTGELMTRMDLYTMYLPRLTRWEAELAVDDLARGVNPEAIGAELERFTRASDRIATVAEGAPDLVGRERAAALEAVRSERRAVLDMLHQERVATLAELEAISQRLVDRSSGPLEATVRKDLEDLVRAVEAMRKRLMDETQTALDAVVDHAFVRAVELLLIAAVLGALGLVLYARVLRR